MKRKALFICALIVLVSLLVSPAYAHPGRTDGQGGHLNHSTGEYHYHHGMSAHDHYDMDGDGIAYCPFNFVDKTDENTQKTQLKAETNTTKEKKSEKKKVREFLVDIMFVFPLWYLVSMLITVPVCKLMVVVFKAKDDYFKVFAVVSIIVFVAGIVFYYYYVK